MEFFTTTLDRKNYRHSRVGYFIYLIVFLLFISVSSYSQYVIHGTVTDELTGEVLISATVFDSITMKGTVSNDYGFYSLKPGGDEVVLICSYVGYSPSYLLLTLKSDTSVNIFLSPSLALDEVTISGQSSDLDIFSSQMSSHNINRINLKTLPTLLGETDLVKAMQYLPGVSSGTEGTSGIYVRGGSSDQNLILLDGVPVYNVNHLFGFYSVFNGDAVNSATLLKGGFPARYSGRLSSVIDIGLKEGNMKEFHGSASLGIISSKLLLEGPIVKDKTSFLISGRRTYYDILSYPIQYAVNKRNKSDTYFGYYFYDLNAKINHKFSDKSRLFFSSYLGKDEFYINETDKQINPDDQKTYDLDNKMGFYWGNITSALRWNYIWGTQLFSNLTLSYSNYRFTNFESSEHFFSYENRQPVLETDQTYGLRTYDYEYYSGIRDLSMRLNFSYIPSPNHYLRFGIRGTSYAFKPGVQDAWYEWENIGISHESVGADSVDAFEFVAYIEDDFSIGDRFKSNIGVNTSAFVVDGKTYYSIEPRVSARFKITDRLVYKASYAKMSQNIHLLTNSMMGLPTDIWVPTTKNIIPEESWQVATGLKYKHGSEWEFSFELFYKDLQNLVEYAEGADLLLNGDNWESKVVSGDGLVYGAEFFVEKTAGRWTGSMGYTWSKNTRTFENISF